MNNDNSGYLIITLEYQKLLFNFEDGTNFINCLRSAKLFDKSYDSSECNLKTLPAISIQYIPQDLFNTWQTQELLDV